MKIETVTRLLEEALNLLYQDRSYLPEDSQKRVDSLITEYHYSDKVAETMADDIANAEASEGLQWWGYEHRTGTVQAKRYFDDKDLAEARESQFIRTVVPPFRAKTRDEALRIVIQLSGHHCLYSKDKDQPYPRACKRCGVKEVVTKTTS